MGETGRKSRLRLQQIADHAGVSVSTVSRVINAVPGISVETGEAVMRSIQILTRSKVEGQAASSSKKANGVRVAFIVKKPHSGVVLPAYEHLLRGVTAGAWKLGVDLQASFVLDASAAIEQVAAASYDGLILHGVFGPPEQTQPWHKIPTVWLMGNPTRPEWGDQVMPNNTAIGHLAADYLLQRKHRRIISLGYDTGWSLSIRTAAFQHAVRLAGGSVTNCVLADMPQEREESMNLISAELVRSYFAQKERPTGLFISEDWLVRRVFNVMRAAGIRPGEDLEVISCNNDRPYLAGASPMPATIDIRHERIGELAIERLWARMTGHGPKNRLRLVVEPKLIPGETPEASPSRRNGKLATAG